MAGYGLATGGVLTLSPILIVQVVGRSERIPQALGLYTAVYGLTGMLGPPFGGLMFDTFHKYDFAFLGSGIAMLLSAIGFFLVKQSKITQNKIPIANGNALNMPILSVESDSSSVHLDSILKNHTNKSVPNRCTRISFQEKDDVS